jgi:alcohol dehydrogenase (cytochrome c)/quinohemoprotein ethanol dehydrogenase
MLGRTLRFGFIAAALVFAVTACGPRGPAAVDTQRLVNANREPGQWMSHGRTYDEQRFSPLDRINAENVSRLGLAWFADLDTNRGQEATPIVVDGVLYVSTAWSMVKAYNAVTGAPLWSYDPQVARDWGVHACCDVVNRGVAVWRGKVFVGALDGRLIALDARTGREVWETQTIDPAKPYTITGAPRVIDGLVVIGNGGAEFGVRGYVSAYDAQNGRLRWRFYTTPNPRERDNAASDPVRDRALATWNVNAGVWRESGGGGTVWDSMAYDPQLGLLYVGVGNGSPWNRTARSPGRGDNLFLSSIVALRASTGEYVWHYQTTPGEEWDYTATQHIILADLVIGGHTRQVLMQAPKNGFFYVLDRRTGEFISAAPYSTINWATGIDPRTHRPIEAANARYSETGIPFVAMPGPMGAHSWHPMSFSPRTGLVYIPVIDAAFPYIPENDFQPQRLGFNVGLNLGAGSMPRDPAVRRSAMEGLKGSLLAWDPVNQREAFRIAYPGPWNGGLLTTAGDLLIQGTAGGEFTIYRASNGQRLWSMPAQTGIVAAPVTYEIGGEQYIAVLAGWGGVFALAPGELSFKSGRQRNISRLLVFKLGGTARLPAAAPVESPPLDPPPATASPEIVAQGGQVYARYCGTCHGDSAVSGGLVPDLRYSALLASDTWFDVVLGGAMHETGMASFEGVLSRDQVAAARDYVISLANHDATEIRAGRGAPGVSAGPPAATPSPGAAARP